MAGAPVWLERQTRESLRPDSRGVQSPAYCGTRWQGARLGRSWKPIQHVTHIRNGKMMESWIFGENQDEVDAFWG
jgi:hypothetical protein